MNSLDAQIRQVISRFEDLFESHIFDQISVQNHAHNFSIDLHRLTQEVDSFVETVEKMEAAYVDELDSLLPEEVEAADRFGGSDSKMVGISDLFDEIILQFTRPNYAGLPVFSLFGMAGIGKTALARKVYDDLEPFRESCLG